MHRVLITGATGLVGRRLAASLTADGIEVLAVSRDPQRAQERVPELTAAFAWDGGVFPAEALKAVDAVVHLAGEPVPGRWTDSKKAAIRDSRVGGTQRLVDAIAKRELSPRPSTLVSASAVGWYGPGEDEEVDEETPAGDDFLARVCAGWESTADKAAEYGVRVVKIRFGIILDPDGGALAQMLPTARLGLSGPLGGGRQWWSWLHRDDAVALIRFALAQSSVSGVLAGSTPNPVRQRDFARTLGQVLRRPSFLPGPAWAIKLALGGFAVEVLSGKRQIPRRTIEAGFRFAHPELASALGDLVGGA